MDADLVETIEQRIHALQIGDRFFLKELLADIWMGLGDGNARRDIGSKFAQAVVRGEFPKCRQTDPKGRIRDARYIRVE